MSANDRLTIEELERVILNHESGMQLTGVNIYRQLLDTMRENERLRKDLENRGVAFTELNSTVFTFGEPNKESSPKFEDGILNNNYDPPEGIGAIMNQPTQKSVSYKVTTGTKLCLRCNTAFDGEHACTKTPG